MTTPTSAPVRRSATRPRRRVGAWRAGRRSGRAPCAGPAPGLRPRRRRPHSPTPPSPTRRPAAEHATYRHARPTATGCSYLWTMCVWPWSRPGRYAAATRRCAPRPSGHRDLRQGGPGAVALRDGPRCPEVGLGVTNARTEGIDRSHPAAWFSGGRARPQQRSTVALKSARSKALERRVLTCGGRRERLGAGCASRLAAEVLLDERDQKRPRASSHAGPGAFT